MSDNYEESKEFLDAVDSLNEADRGKYVEGTVLHIMPSEIQVDIGRKCTGIIRQEDYSSDPDADPTAELKPGDKIGCIILRTNESEGIMYLSKKIFDSSKNWKTIEDAFAANEILEGKVAEKGKGGLAVYVNGVRIFVPASQATAKRSDDLDADLAALVNQVVRLKVIDIKPNPRSGKKEAVGSIRAVYKEETKAAREAFWNEIYVGQTFNGKVKSITEFGCFVDLGLTDGLLHRSEISWQRFNKVSDVVSVGDEIEVFVKSFDPEKKKISLGHKKIEDNPWEILKRDYPVGTICEVEIANLVTFGAFAHIIPGIDGLIYIGEIADRRINEPAEVLTVGQKVAAKITEIDFDKKRISLSMRQVNEAAEENDTYDEEPETDNAVLGDAVPIDAYKDMVSDED